MKQILKKYIAIILIFILVACNNNSIGELKDGVYKSEKDGHNSKIELQLEVKEGKIDKVTVLEQNETAGLGDVAINTIIDKFNQEKKFEGELVSGATISSRATIEGIKDLLIQAGLNEDQASELLLIKENDNDLKVEKEQQFDVVIVGAGGAGLSAAIEAAESGASVCVLEKTGVAGGNTLVSGGGLNAPETRQQKKLGIEDSKELFYEDTLKGGDNRADKKLVNVMAEKALSAADWLMDTIGVEFMDERVQQFGGHSVPRALIPKGNKGVELINKLLTKAEDKGVKVFYSTEAKEIQMQEGQAKAIIAEKDGQEITFNANKGIIIASGGFASNVEMRKKYNSNYDERFKTTATKASTGDGIVMAEKIGANLVDLDLIQVYPTCNPVTGIISYVANARFDGAILVNQNGERFVNEMGRRDDISNEILAQEGAYAYLVWGDDIESVGNMTKLHEDEYNSLLKDDLIYKADTIEEAAKHFNIMEEKLEETISKFNEYVESGEDQDFAKGGKLRPIEKGSFYIQKVVPSAHHTMGGVQINENAQVLDTNGEVIKNLYAAGEVVGGIHGTNRLGGNAITDIIVFGRIAGENVVK